MPEERHPDRDRRSSLLVGRAMAWSDSAGAGGVSSAVPATTLVLDSSPTVHCLPRRGCPERVRSRQCQGFPRNPGRFHPGSGLSPSLDQLGSIEREAAFVVKCEYRRNHLPIGSGVTEAACKTVFTQRLKQSG